MPQKTQLDQALELVSAVEEEAVKGLTSDLGRNPNVLEIRDESIDIANAIGRNFVSAKALVDAQPGPLEKVGIAASDAIGSVVKPAAQFIGRSLAERTQSLRDDESSLPTLQASFPRIGRARNALAEGLNAVSGAIGGTLGLPPGAPPIDTNRPPPSFSIGPEFAADTLEVLGPLAAEFGLAVSKRVGVPGFIAGTLAANVSAEVGAEYLRIVNRQAAGLPLDAFSLDNASDAAKHFGLVAVGGLFLGGADLVFNSGQLRTQRKIYKTVFGLSTPASKEAVERVAFLSGSKANLTEASTTGMKVIGHSLKVFPLTAKTALRRSKKLVKRLGERLNAQIADIGDNLASGSHFASVPSKAWQKANDAALQQARKIGNAGYVTARGLSEAAEKEFGRSQVHIPHAEIRSDLDDFILGRTADLPLVGKGVDRRVATTAVGSDVNFQLLNDVLDLPDTPSIVQYMKLRNQLEAASEAAGGVNTDIGSIYGIAAMKMRGAILKMNAPDDVKLAFEAATTQWSDMISLTQSSAWKHFRRADPKFGFPNKVGGPQSTSAEVTLQRAMTDKDISPEIVETWWRAAKMSKSESQFRGAVETHLRLGFEAAQGVAEKGPLSGEKVINFSRFEKFLGADIPSSTKWEANALMIRRAGGKPEEVLKFIQAAKLAFPDGIPSPSTTAARRVGLAGIASAARFATGIGVIGTVSGGGAISTAFAGTAAFMGLIGAGQLFFNPAILRRMTRIMEGGMTDQGIWRTLFAVSTSVGLSRAFQNLLQESGIDPIITKRRIVQERDARELRRLNAPVELPGQAGFFGTNPITRKTNGLPGATIGPVSPNIPNLNPVQAERIRRAGGPPQSPLGPQQ